MCGICGKISFSRQTVQDSLMRTMCRSFAYRGPDDEGTYINKHRDNSGFEISVGLGHKRLSIIDLSPAAHQPMSNEDGTVWITYNGEVYNHKELKEKLERKRHRFKSDSDTEVVLHLYEEEGQGAVEQLNGMFAFALWDRNLGRLWVCRDRLGIKPIVYYWDGKHFVFASEIKALLADPSIPKELDYEALNLYLTFNYVPAPYTIFKGIRKLEPGHFLILENGNLEITKYWDAPGTIDPEIASLPFAEQETFYKDRLFYLLNNAVSSRMIADVPLGAFLSGGIDSSVIVALMARNSEKPVQTFSIGYKNDAFYDETEYAREVAGIYKTDHHEFKLSHEDMLDALDNVLSTFDEPFADSSAIPTYIVARETKNHVTVALSGDGGDELFAGYRSYLSEYWYTRYMQIPGLFRKGLIENFIQSLPDSRDVKILEYIRRLKKFIKATKGSFPERLLALKEVFPEEIRKNILLNNYNNRNGSQDLPLGWINKLLGSYKGDRINSMLYSDLKDSLPGDMLTKVDWMSMKNSLEVRVPLLDHRVVELAFRMKGSLKLNNGKTKYILKETFKDLLPPSLYNQPKAGFEVPISRWLKKDLKFLIDQYLAKEKLREQGIFDSEIVDDLIQKHLSNKTDTSWMLWNLIVFQQWCEKKNPPHHHPIRHGWIRSKYIAYL
jgi:asparagine synthase (glutamine-hydrolysing)